MTIRIHPRMMIAVAFLAAGLMLPAGCRNETGDVGGAPNPASAASREVLPQPDLAYPALEGRAVFQHYCAVCHGAEGKGDGFNSYNLDPKPRDLSLPEFQKSRTDDDLAAVIRTGGGAAGLSTGMPPWSPTLNKRQIEDVVLYIRTLGKKASNGPAAQ